MTEKRERLSVLLVEVQKSADQNCTVAARTAARSQSWWSKITGGALMPTYQDVEQFLTTVGVHPTYKAEVLAPVEELAQRNEEKRLLIHSEHSRTCHRADQREAAARTVRDASSQHLPDLLRAVD